MAHNWAFTHSNDREVPVGSRNTLFENMMQTKDELEDPLACPCADALVASFLFCFCDDKTNMCNFKAILCLQTYGSSGTENWSLFFSRVVKNFKRGFYTCSQNRKSKLTISAQFCHPKMAKMTSLPKRGRF